MKFLNVEQAIEDLKNGKMLVMVDAEDRENEGDLIFAAQHSTHEKVNFMIKEARGVVCVALSQQLAKKFELPLMVSKNTSNHETAFTITVDSKEASTGVSAKERDMTIRIFADEKAVANDFVRPGHINPLIAKKGGVLERTGHTEGTVDLCRLAGLKEACVICEIVKDDGTMARRKDLEEFCNKYKLGMIAVSDLIEYRLKNESLIYLLEESETLLAGFGAQKYIFNDHNQMQHIAFCFGKPKKTENVKFHISGSDFELLTSQKFSKLLEQIQFLAENGGIIIFMHGEKSSKTHFKNYGIGAQILRYFGIEEIQLLSESCDKDFIGLKGFGLNIKTCNFTKEK
ncbi:bifunctional 3,4-dihydroxy-2-butanone 4-phosphate synthase/GTP cyclohydrolase II [Campylobacter sp. MIT 21-1685]|uniref:bifunctional 3,4-dihydroxy-2-butanone 4-phosphate synthase/GTP cyclohydrolase II n=1 Tax=unclassified Campylobacter TaxID=2593542 RepID=UPI00224B068A|nr:MULTISPECIES: bifunctional 3,4-dihydroxy-2-butanone 4-phosphate synthase/GTP cyclohydrolase II [unclassified Campylobacter]MCX2682922.1 bifunctional 3,4-dihydroxy-2-butanone 4-phosphate synthase/GTP cyclohydrolase II [Campylobacter sp. MIT 21-1684]MCX2751130.1 bifunctional 3,4-dihydroxy-2-butanone 4-phosphate synthase/GTP cyclohydrolase II [Campylobacter sp. MIT 21-1682]MCX2807403.1 bifunctional 3,4-dihydroxy-2-butanone 4-phosphate synthase/GTP cyclohydrolase II [Campylobacter sp. MIT 21-1685